RRRAVGGLPGGGCLPVGVALANRAGGPGGPATGVAGWDTAVRGRGRRMSAGGPGVLAGGRVDLLRRAGGVGPASAPATPAAGGHLMPRRPWHPPQAEGLCSGSGTAAKGSTTPTAEEAVSNPRRSGP